MDFERFIRKAIEVGKNSVDQGDLPYGCVLVGPDGNIIAESGNVVNSQRNLIAHAEISMISSLKNSYPTEFLKECVIFTSDEPCSMCSSAIYWAGFKALVFGLRKSRYYEVFGRNNPDWDFEHSAESILSKGKRYTEVSGPYLEDEVLDLHRYYRNVNFKK